MYRERKHNLFGSQILDGLLEREEDNTGAAWCNPGSGAFGERFEEQGEEMVL